MTDPVAAQTPTKHAWLVQPWRYFAAALLSVIIADPAVAQGGGRLQREPAHRADSSAAMASVESFREALAKGDSSAALALLSPDVIVLESGDVERYADYRSHHLAADIEYARGVPSKHTTTSVQVVGDAAWVASTSTAQGQFKGRAVNSVGAELMVLSRARSGAPWRIRAIHWSSRRKPS